MEEVLFGLSRDDIRHVTYQMKTQEINLLFSKTPKSGLIYGATTFGSRVIAQPFSGQRPSWFCPI